jgi:hypothetical protein
MLTAEPAPLAFAAWQMSTAYARIAVLADEEQADRHAEMAEDLASKLRDAHTHWGTLQTPDKLAARTAESSLFALDDQAVAGDATLTLVLPIGRATTVRLGQVDHHGPNEGWTVVGSDSRCWTPRSPAPTTSPSKPPSTPSRRSSPGT